MISGNRVEVSRPATRPRRGDHGARRRRLRRGSCRLECDGRSPPSSCGAVCEQRRCGGRHRLRAEERPRDRRALWWPQRPGDLRTDSGLMIDLAGLRTVRVDPEVRRASVQGGAAWGPGPGRPAVGTGDHRGKRFPHRSGRTDTRRHGLAGQAFRSSVRQRRLVRDRHRGGCDVACQ